MMPFTYPPVFDVAYPITGRDGDGEVDYLAGLRAFDPLVSLEPNTGQFLGAPFVPSSGTDVVGMMWGGSASNDAVEISSATLDTAMCGADKKFRIKARFYITSLATLSYIIAKYDSASQRSYYIYVDTGGSLSFWWFSDGSSGNSRRVQATANVVAGRWYDIEVQYDGTVDTGDGVDRVTMYQDGKSEPEPVFLTSNPGTLGPIYAGTSRHFIGAVAATGVVNFPATGIIRDVEIYDDNLAGSLIESWEGNGNTAADWVGSQGVVDGTVLGSPDAATQRIAEWLDQGGSGVTGMWFDGIDDLASVPDSTEYDLLTNFSWEFELTTSASFLSDTRTVMAKWNSGNSAGWGVRMETGKFNIGFRKGIGDYYGGRTTTVFAPSTTYLLRVEYPGDGSVPKLYVDGVDEPLVSFITLGDGLNGITDHVTELQFGGGRWFSTTNSYMQGVIREIKTWNVAVGGTDDNLVGYWKGTGSNQENWYDYSKYSNDGAVTGSPNGAVQKADGIFRRSNDVEQATNTVQPAVGTDGPSFDVDWMREGSAVENLGGVIVHGAVVDLDKIPVSSSNIIFDGDSGQRMAVAVTTSDGGAWYLYAGTAVISPKTAKTGLQSIISVFDGASSKLYVNNILQVAGDPGTTTPLGFTVGARYDGANNYFDGRILSTHVIKAPASVDDAREALWNYHQTIMPSLPALVTGRLVAELPTRLTFDIDASDEPDGSNEVQTNEVVHPKIVNFDTAWNGYEDWMVITPYPAGDPTFENPSIMVRIAGVWAQHPTIDNPIAPQPVGSTTQGDTTMVYDSVEDRLVVFYLRRVGTEYQIRMTYSGDGVTWSAPVEVEVEAANVLASPSVVWDSASATWRLYLSSDVNLSGGALLNLVYFSSLDLYTTDWGPETICEEEGIPEGFQQWDGHIVIIDGRYYNFTSVADGLGGADARLCLGVSDDGGHSFDYNDYVILNADTYGTEWPNTHVYTTDIEPFVEDGETKYKLTVTGRKSDGTWGMGETTARLSSYITPPDPMWTADPAQGQTVNVSDEITSSDATLSSGGAHTSSSVTGTPQILKERFDFTAGTAEYVTWGSGSGLLGKTDYAAAVTFRIDADLTSLQVVNIVQFGGVLLQVSYHVSLGNLVTLQYWNGAAFVTHVQPFSIPSGEDVTIVVARVGDELRVTSERGEYYRKDGMTSFTLLDSIDIGSSTTVYTGEIAKVEIYGEELTAVACKTIALRAGKVEFLKPFVE